MLDLPFPSIEEDDEFVAALRSGHLVTAKLATERFYKRHYRVLSYWARRHSPDSTEAEDLTQETVVTVIDYLRDQSESERLVHRSKSLRSLLIKVVVTKAITRARSRRRTWARESEFASHGSSLAWIASPEETLNDTERARHLRAAIAGLPPAQREGIEATLCGEIFEASQKKRLQRNSRTALRNLRRLLTRKGVDHG